MSSDLITAEIIDAASIAALRAAKAGVKAGKALRDIVESVISESGYSVTADAVMPYAERLASAGDKQAVIDAIDRVYVTDTLPDLGDTSTPIEPRTETAHLKQQPMQPMLPPRRGLGFPIALAIGVFLVVIGAGMFRYGGEEAAFVRAGRVRTWSDYHRGLYIAGVVVGAVGAAIMVLSWGFKRAARDRMVETHCH